MSRTLRIDVDRMPRIVFTGDSQTVGCVGAMDYAQMLSWELPLRVFNRSVGGSNTTHLLAEFGGGTVTVTAGERIIHGEGTSWFAGPYIGQRLRVAGQEYVLDAVETLDYAKKICRAYLTEPAREDYHGTDYAFEPGWRVRIAELEPDYACFMYTVNDPGWKPEEFKARLAEIVRRCRAAGIQPIFLSGVPFMDAAAGGSHPGAVAVTRQRAQDLLEFCQAEKLPYGDVFRTLERLDPQRTCVWADTIHPTNDGSMVAVQALRALLRELGATANPYFVRGYRTPGPDLPRPDDASLTPITTAQPRRDRDNRLDQKGHNLEAQRLRDEYGLVASRDGQLLTSPTPLLFEVGVGSAEALESFEVEVAPTLPGQARVYNWSTGTWTALERIDPRAPADYVHAGALWVGVAGESPALDYLSVNISGEVAAWEPPAADRALLWPSAGQFDWTQQGNLFPDGALTRADGDGPGGWRKSGDRALYLPETVVAKGTGRFAEPTAMRFESPGAGFTQQVRPLDLLVVDAPLERGANFLVAKVADDETLALRRAPGKALEPMGFEVRRGAGLQAVPGAGCLEVREGSEWRFDLPLPRGDYRFGCFYRAFAPETMSATARPVVRPVVQLSDGQPLAGSGPAWECCFLWQRGWLDLSMPADGTLQLSLLAAGEGAMQFTGFSLVRR